jgi:hypothetical protein
VLSKLEQRSPLRPSDTLAILSHQKVHSISRHVVLFVALRPFDACCEEAGLSRSGCIVELNVSDDGLRNPSSEEQRDTSYRQVGIAGRVGS